MKRTLSKKEAKKKIEDFFKRKELDPKYTRKIKRLSMKYKIRLEEHRKRFCKKCFSDLKKGKVRITKHYKTIICDNCGERKKFRIS